MNVRIHPRKSRVNMRIHPETGAVYPAVQLSLALPLQVYTSAVALGVVEPPVPLRQRQELFPTIVLHELTVHFSLALPLQV